ncbi:hypothetical protein Tsubulata_041973 [Turnera subulata]|uniref:SHSP domain-containing protein n=1 Tax=Turnera subulata TaxID=218843 RepID=A0A9Q0FTY6_9ROSI|nr:hypothetical protein Tsubulata_041973 [Turnera subulata]
MNTLSNVLRSAHLHHRLSFTSSARYFRSTVAPLKGPFGGGGGDDDEAEDFESFMTRQAEKTKAIYHEYMAMHPDPSSESFKKPTLSVALASYKRGVMAKPPEAAAYMSELMYWHPFQVGGVTRHFDVKTDDGGYWYGRMDLPGVGGGRVKVKVQGNTLYFSGEEEDEGFEGGAREYSGKFDIPAGEYQIDKIVATLKNGVLEVLIPKIKKN